MLSWKTGDSWLKKGKKTGRTEIHKLKITYRSLIRNITFSGPLCQVIKKSPDKSLVLNNLLGYPVSFALSRFSVSKAKTAITFK